MMKELTKAEEQIMPDIVGIETGICKGMSEQLPKPKPATTTVSTIIRILEGKGFVDHEAFGTTHRYFPVVEYRGVQSFCRGQTADQLLWQFCRKMFSSFSTWKSRPQRADEILKLIEDLKRNKNERAHLFVAGKSVPAPVLLLLPCNAPQWDLF